MTATIDLPGPGTEGERPEFVVLGEEGLYVLDKRARLIHLIDPATNKVILTKPSGGFTIVPALEEEGLWTVDCDTGTLLLLDPKTLERVGELAPIQDACGVATGEGSVWVTTYNTIVRVAPQR